MLALLVLIRSKQVTMQMRDALAGRAFLCLFAGRRRTPVGISCLCLGCLPPFATVLDISWTTNLQAGFLAQLRNCTILSHITCLALLLSLNSLLWASYEVHISCTLFHHVASLADTKSAVAGRIEPLHTPRNTDPARPGNVSCFGICPCNLAALCAKAPHFMRITNPKASKDNLVASNQKSLLLNEHPRLPSHP